MPENLPSPNPGAAAIVLSPDTYRKLREAASYRILPDPKDFDTVTRAGELRFRLRPKEDSQSPAGGNGSTYAHPFQIHCRYEEAEWRVYVTTGRITYLNWQGGDPIPRFVEGAILFDSTSSLEGDGFVGLPVGYEVVADNDIYGVWAIHNIGTSIIDNPDGTEFTSIRVYQGDPGGATILVSAAYTYASQSLDCASSLSTAATAIYLGNVNLTDGVVLINQYRRSDITVPLATLPVSMTP